MRLCIIILCLVPFQVQASDWLNRTIRVDLVVNRTDRAYDPKYVSLEPSNDLLSGVVSTNGQYPWSIFTIAWAQIGQGSFTGHFCVSTIISSNFFLSDFICAGQHITPAVTFIEAYYGSVRLYNSRWFSPDNLVRHYWYIEPSPVDSPSLLLARFHETVTFNPNVQPIRLPSPDNFSYEGWSSYLLESELFTFGRHSQWTQANILVNSECDIDGIIDDYEICATDGSEGFQAVSPGGAWLVYEYTAGFEFIPVLVGIGRFMNQSWSFLVASRVSHFVGWIETLQQEN